MLQFGIGDRAQRYVDVVTHTVRASVRAARLRARSEQLAQRINLHLALGGSFDDTSAVPVAARAASAPGP